MFAELTTEPAPGPATLPPRHPNVCREASIGVVHSCSSFSIVHCGCDVHQQLQRKQTESQRCCSSHCVGQLLKQVLPAGDCQCASKLSRLPQGLHCWPASHDKLQHTVHVFAIQVALFRRGRPWLCGPTAQKVWICSSHQDVSCKVLTPAVSQPCAINT